MIEKTFIKDLYVVNPKKFEDVRGWFFEPYNKKVFEDNNIFIDFVQDNHSLSNKKGTLRGIHFQAYPYEQAKLVRCTRGSVFDVAVDLRKNSETYLKWFGIELSADNKKQLLIPRGFGHGFITLTDEVEFQYKVDNYYNKESDRSIRYNDPDINIKWPIADVILSEKDLKAPFIKEN